MWVPLEQPSDRVGRELARRIGGRAKFLVDENLGNEVALAIRSQGFNVKFAPFLGLGGRSDEAVFARACAERRILLTHDRDFLNDKHFPFHRNPGVVVLPGAHGSNRGLVKALGQLLGLLGLHRDLYRNAKIEISEDGAWNIRHLEKEQGLMVHTRLSFARNGQVFIWENDG